MEKVNSSGHALPFAMKRLLWQLQLKFENHSPVIDIFAVLTLLVGYNVMGLVRRPIFVGGLSFSRECDQRNGIL